MKAATASSFSRGASLPRVRLVDRRQQQRPALGEELVEDLVLGGEVVVDEAVGDPRLVGDVGDPGRVKALAGEDPDRGVEDLAALVDGHRGSRPGLIRPRTSCGHAVGLPGRRLASEGSDSRIRSCASRSSSAATKHSSSGAVASTTPQGSTIASARRRRSAAAPRRPGSGRARRPGSRSPGRAAGPPSGRGRWSAVNAEGTVTRRAPRTARIR